MFMLRVLPVRAYHDLADRFGWSWSIGKSMISLEQIGGRDPFFLINFLVGSIG